MRSEKQELLFGHKRLPGVPDIIIDSFYSLCTQPHESEMPDFYVGSPKRYNCPFNTTLRGGGVLIDGAEYKYYKNYTVPQWGEKIDNLKQPWNEEEEKVVNNNPETWEEEEEKFSAAFERAYNNFIADIVDKRVGIFPTEENRARAVFEFATDYKLILSNKSFSIISTPKLLEKGNEDSLCFENRIGGFDKQGEFAGYLLHAWTIIFANYKIFEPLFIEAQSESKPTTQAAPAPKQTSAPAKSKREPQHLKEYFVCNKAWERMIIELEGGQYITVNSIGIRWDKSKVMAGGLIRRIVRSSLASIPDEKYKFLAFVLNATFYNMNLEDDEAIKKAGAHVDTFDKIIEDVEKHITKK